MSVNGSTAMDLAGLASGVEFGGVMTVDEPNALIRSAALVNRSAGSLASALVTAASSSAVTPDLVARTEGTGSVKRFMIRACAVAPVKGAEPVSISYNTQPRL